jgi:hypothetical protein
MTNKAIFAIYGASGFGREVMPLAREQLQRLGLSPSQLVFIDDQPQVEQINGQRIVRYTEFLACAAKERYQPVEKLTSQGIIGKLNSRLIFLRRLS